MYNMVNQLSADTGPTGVYAGRRCLQITLYHNEHSIHQTCVRGCMGIYEFQVNAHYIL